MERDHLAEVGLAQRVAVEREEALVELAAGEADRTARTERLVLDRVLEAHRVVARPEPGLDLVGQVAARDDRALDAVPARCSNVYARSGRSTSGSMSLRVRSVSGRSLVPWPPTRMTAGRVTGRGGRCPRRRSRARASRPGSRRFRPSTITWPRMLLGRRGPVELAELGPLGDDHGRVRAVERVERRLGDLDAVQMRRAVGDRIPRRDLRALGQQATGEDEARRLAHVVRAGLEREPEERDPLAAKRPESPLELPDDAPLLELVDLDDGVQELEVVARVRRELLERERVLGEARAAVADAGAEERRADAAVEADCLGDRRPRRRPSPRRRSRSR